MKVQIKKHKIGGGGGGCIYKKKIFFVQQRLLQFSPLKLMQHKSFWESLFRNGRKSYCFFKRQIVPCSLDKTSLQPIQKTWRKSVQLLRILVVKYKNAKSTTTALVEHLLPLETRDTWEVASVRHFPVRGWVKTVIVSRCQVNHTVIEFIAVLRHQLLLERVLARGWKTATKHGISVRRTSQRESCKRHGPIP